MSQLPQVSVLQAQGTLISNPNIGGYKELLYQERVYGVTQLESAQYEVVDLGSVVGLILYLRRQGEIDLPGREWYAYRGRVHHSAANYTGHKHKEPYAGANYR